MLYDILYMKRLFIYFTIILTVLSVNIFAQAGGSGGYDSRQSSGNVDYMRVFEYAGIILNDSQRRTMDGCIGMYDSETRIILADIRELNNSVRDELLKSKPDRKAIKSYITKKKEKEALIEYMNIERDLTILETLTPEQRTMFYNYQERMRTRMRHGGGHMMR